MVSRLAAILLEMRARSYSIERGASAAHVARLAGIELDDCIGEVMGRDWLGSSTSYAPSRELRAPWPVLVRFYAET